MNIDSHFETSIIFWPNTFNNSILEWYEIGILYRLYYKGVLHEWRGQLTPSNSLNTYKWNDITNECRLGIPRMFFMSRLSIDGSRLEMIWFCISNHTINWRHLEDKIRVGYKWIEEIFVCVISNVIFYHFKRIV